VSKAYVGDQEGMSEREKWFWDVINALESGGLASHEVMLGVAIARFHPEWAMALYDAMEEGRKEHETAPIDPSVGATEVLVRAYPCPAAVTCG
jgi:hypothetical protein